MAYDTNELKLVAQGGPSGQIWAYEGTDTAATVIAAAFISDAQDRGMKVGDLLVVREFGQAAKTSITTQSLHTVTAVASTGATAGAALAGGGTVHIGTGTATIAAADDVVDGYSAGSIYIETDAKEPSVAISTATAAANWVSAANDVVLSYTALTMATAATTMRFVAPFTGRITAVRAVLNGTVTGTAKAVRLTISGTTVTSGSLSITAASPTNTKFAASPTTGNKIVAGYTIGLQTGATAMAGAKTANFFVVCRRQSTT